MKKMDSHRHRKFQNIQFNFVWKYFYNTTTILQTYTHRNLNDFIIGTASVLVLTT